MARSIWSGSISFGLVNIPVKLVTATQEKSVRFHQLHESDHERIRYKLVCPAEEKEVPREEIVKGYEVAPEQYVIVKEEELEALEPERSRTVDILGFVDQAQIDPVFYDRPYYLLPDERSGKAYQLLQQAMSRSDKVAIAKFVMREKEYLAALRPVDKAICMEIMRYAGEVLPADKLEGLPQKASATEAEMKMAQQLIDSLSMEFEPQKYHDEYRERLEDLIHKKAEGQEVVLPPPEEEKLQVIDLMSALKKSLEEARKQRGKPRKTG